MLWSGRREAADPLWTHMWNVHISKTDFNTFEIPVKSKSKSILCPTQVFFSLFCAVVSCLLKLWWSSNYKCLKPPNYSFWGSTSCFFSLQLLNNIFLPHYWQICNTSVQLGDKRDGGKLIELSSIRVCKVLTLKARVGTRAGLCRCSACTFTLKELCSHFNRSLNLPDTKAKELRSDLWSLSCAILLLLLSPVPLVPLQSLPLFILLLNQGWSWDGVFENSSGPGHVWRELLFNQGEPMLLFSWMCFPVSHCERDGDSSFLYFFSCAFECINSYVSSDNWISNSCVKKKNPLWHNEFNESKETCKCQPGILDFNVNQCFW